MRISAVVDVVLARRAQIVAEAVGAVEGLTPAVVITGGSQGIGLALAKQFARSGSRVAIVARGVDDLKRAADKIERASGQRPITFSLDVTDKDAGLRIEEELANAGAYLDVLVNSAAMGLTNNFVDEAIEDIERLIAVNITAVTRLTHYALPKMLARGRGGIINIASFAGFVPGPYQAAYYASKAYLISLGQSIAEEEIGKGVRICTVAPGPVDTGFHADMGAEGALYRRLPLSMSPEAVAASIYRGYRMGHRLIVPGIFNRLLAAITGVIPSPILAAVMSRLLWPGEPGEHKQQAEK
jgi:short-subunit dehydrogenase